MKKFWILFLFFTIFNVYFGQITDSKKVIDSISAQKWKQSLPDIDSLTEVALIGIKVNPKDTIILKQTPVFPAPAYDAPLTT